MDWKRHFYDRERSINAIKWDPEIKYKTCGSIVPKECEPNKTSHSSSFEIFLTKLSLKLENYGQNEFP